MVDGVGQVFGVFMGPNISGSPASEHRASEEESGKEKRGIWP